jgi:hypothetical protein
MGGTDDESNLIRDISLTRHAMFHFTNWQLWGKPEDLLAWKGLAGQKTKEEILLEILSLAGKKGSRVTNSRHAEAKKEWGRWGGKNGPRDVKVANGKNLQEWHRKNPELHALADARRAEACRKTVKIRDVDTGETAVFPSVKAAAEFLGIHQSMISNVLSGRNRQTCGFTAEFLS